MLHPIVFAVLFGGGTAVATVKAPAPLAAPALPGAASVHPLLLGPLSDPASPIGAAMDLQLGRLVELGRLSALTPEAAELQLAGLAQGTPVEQMAAKVLARALVEPEATVALQRELPEAGAERLHAVLGTAQSWGRAPGLVALAEQARRDPNVGKLLSAEGPGLELENVEFKRGKLWADGGKRRPIGAGAFGAVFEHPRMEGAVLKVADISFDGFMSGATPKSSIEGDVVSAAALDRAGVAAKVLGRATVSGRPALVKEKVYGETLQSLIYRRKYGPEQHGLVLEMVDRMAAARVRVADMNPANVMIGTTLTNPRVRAIHIDGGQVEEVAEAETEEQVRQSVYGHVSLTKWRVDRNVGMIETYQYFGHTLETALRQAQAKTLWERFTAFVQWVLDNAYFPAK